jgi:MoaA/NifB/PqqE/SkfB family radical SAM enzyme
MKFSRMLVRWPASLLFKQLYTCNIKVTVRCNLKCQFCGLWKRTFPFELYLENYRTVAYKLRKLGAARVVLTGGEPLLRDDIPEITALFSRRGFSTTLLTNGTLADEAKLLRLKAAGLNDIGISLDSLSSERQDRVCGSKGVWEKAVAAIRNSVDIFDDGIVEVLTTITSDTLEEIPDLVDFIDRDLKAWVVLNPVNVSTGKNSILSTENPDGEPPLPAETVDKVFDTLEKMKRNGSKILVSNRFLNESRQYLKTGNSSWHCDAGTRYFTLFPDGSIAPCSDTPAIGNIMELSPSEIRGSNIQSKAKKLREACGGCIFSCWREASYLFTDPTVWHERAGYFLNSIIKRSRNNAR